MEIQSTSLSAGLSGNRITATASLTGTGYYMDHTGSITVYLYKQNSSGTFVQHAVSSELTGSSDSMTETWDFANLAPGAYTVKAWYRIYNWSGAWDEEWKEYPLCFYVN